MAKSAFQQLTNRPCSLRPVKSASGTPAESWGQSAIIDKINPDQERCFLVARAWHLYDFLLKSAHLLTYVHSRSKTKRFSDPALRLIGFPMQRPSDGDALGVPLSSLIKKFDPKMLLSFRDPLFRTAAVLVPSHRAASIITVGLCWLV